MWLLTAEEAAARATLFATKTHAPELARVARDPGAEADLLALSAIQRVGVVVVVVQIPRLTVAGPLMIALA